MEKLKYHRIGHLPYSEKLGEDDYYIDDNIFLNRKVIVMLKYDGEQCSMDKETTWARSINSQANDEGRRWCERLRKCIVLPFIESENLPNFRMSGENMFWQHTVKYNNLKSPFYGFSVWLDNVCQDWEYTKLCFDEMNIKHPEIIYEGIYDRYKILLVFEKYKKEHEGFVVRVADSYLHEESSKSILKYVKKDFVIPDGKHWNSVRAIKTVNNFVDENGNNVNPWNIIV